MTFTVLLVLVRHSVHGSCVPINIIDTIVDRSGRLAGRRLRRQSLLLHGPNLDFKITFLDFVQQHGHLQFPPYFFVSSLSWQFAIVI